MRMRALVPMVGLLIAACGSPEGDVVASSTTTPVSSTTTTTPGTTTTPPEEEMPENTTSVEAAVADLAAHLGVAEEDVEIVEVRIVEWPDGALGCPQEGAVYTQGVVEGIQVLLGVDERVYDYHAGSDGEPFLCASDDKDGGYDFVPPPGFDES